MGILFIGYISDGGYQILNSQILKAAIPSAVPSSPAVWRIVYPKVYMVQAYAASIIDQGSFYNMGPVNPIVNIIIYIVLITALMLAGFNKKEI